MTQNLCCVQYALGPEGSDQHNFNGKVPDGYSTVKIDKIDGMDDLKK